MMRIVIGLGLVVLLLAGGVAAAAPSATEAKRGGGALVLDGFFCGIQTSPPGQSPPSATFTDQSHLVVTPSGEAMLVCHGDYTPQLSEGETFVFHDGLCELPVGLLGVTATDSHTVVTKSGKVLLFCHLHTGGPGDTAL